MYLERRYVRGRVDLVVYTDVATDLTQAGLDACTLNNALNIAQLIVLVALLKWVRNEKDPDRSGSNSLPR